MKIRILITTALSLAATVTGVAWGDLSSGIANFDQHHWNQAMMDFLDVLQHDPQNVQAHAYVNMTIREIQAAQRTATQEQRLQLLGDASKRLEDNRMDDTALQGAIQNTTKAEENARQERWSARCEEAMVQRQMGHLIAANDLIFQVLQENPSMLEAQRELSELQSLIRKTLDTNSSISVPERYALEGYYAFGQADYANALTAWEKGRVLLDQSYPPEEAAQRMQTLHFEPYEKIARSHVEEEQQLADQRARFEKAVGLYEAGQFSQALEEFRKLAIQDPEYPQLGSYLVQAEAAAEKDRARRLGEEKREQIAGLFNGGISDLEKERYQEAEQAFKTVLTMDPTHAQASSYLEMVQAEMKRRHDPRGAQMHYEAGLIAYASGKLEEAEREWHMAIRMDPQNEKAVNALNKVQKELALSREVP